MPKKSAVTTLNDEPPVTFTCDHEGERKERIILPYTSDSIPADMDSHQYTYWANTSTEDAVSTGLHTAQSHLSNQTRM